jgi:multidrug resistance protein, MATE family
MRRRNGLAGKLRLWILAIMNPAKNQGTQHEDMPIATVQGTSEQSLLNQPFGWSLPGGPWQVLAVAWPMILSTGLFSVTIFVDRMLLYRYSDNAAAGAMGAGTMFWAVTCVPVGIFGYTSTFVAQYFGVKQMDRAMRVVVQGILMAATTAPLVVLLAWGSSWFFASMHEPDLVIPETQYFRWISFGAWVTIVTAPLVGLFAGTNQTRILLICDCVATAVNAILDYVLISGEWGFPELGIIGAALATSISLSLKLVILLWIAYRWRWEGRASSIHLFSVPWSWDSKVINRLLHFGWPAGISTLAEAITFATIMMIVGQLGERAMAATTLALGVNMIAFIPMMGLGISVGVLVGQNLTGGNLQVAQRTVRSGLLIAIVYSGAFACLYGFLPEQVLSVYGYGTDGVRFEEMKTTVIPILRFIAAYCIFDGIQIVFVGALKGAGDTSFVLLGNVVSGFLTVGLGKLIADATGQGGLYWWWGVMTFWVLILAVCFTLRYLHGGWKSKRVIESDFTKELP